MSQLVLLGIYSLATVSYRRRSYIPLKTKQIKERGGHHSYIADAVMPDYGVTSFIISFFSHIFYK